MTNEIKTPLRYPGGKTRAAEMLLGNFPDFKEYREPFLGGGSIFVLTKQRFPDRKYWINDYFYDLYCFWSETKDNLECLTDLINEWKVKYPIGKELHTFLCGNIKNFNKLERAAAFFILNRITFSGTSMSGGFSKGSFEGRFTQSSIDRIRSLPRLLKDVKITNYDYEDLLKEDGDDVFLFLDPPYYTARKSALYGPNGELHKGFDHERFVNNIKECKHKWLITYDNCDYIKSHFYGYNIRPFELMYGMRNVSNNSMVGKEIMITNW